LIRWSLAFNLCCRKVSPLGFLGQAFRGGDVMANRDDGPTVEEVRRMIRALQTLSTVGQESAARQAVRMFSNGFTAPQVDGFGIPLDGPSKS
jgi:hypothetical protein